VLLVERIYVHEAIHDAFVAAFVAEVKRYAIGDPRDEATYIGAITRKAQLEVLRVQVADAVKKAPSLRSAARSSSAKANWFAPTVLTDVDHSMLVMREESFGPIIGIQAVADDDAAIDQMNDTEYGLTAGVYSRDEKTRQAHSEARRCRHGLLELLRPGEPPAAVVGRQTFGDRPDVVDVRHPDVHATEGVASEGVNAGPRNSTY